MHEGKPVIFVGPFIGVGIVSSSAFLIAYSRHPILLQDWKASFSPMVSTDLMFLTVSCECIIPNYMPLYPRLAAPSPASASFPSSILTANVDPSPSPATFLGIFVVDLISFNALLSAGACLGTCTPVRPAALQHQAPPEHHLVQRLGRPLCRHRGFPSARADQTPD